MTEPSKKLKPTEIISEMIDLFSQAQKSSARNGKIVMKLFQLRKANADIFDTQFLNQVIKILPVWKNEPSIERIVKLTVLFCTFDWRCQLKKNPQSEEADEADEWLGVEDFAVQLMQRLLPKTEDEDKAIRFRSTQLIGGIVNSMSERCELQQEVWDQLTQQLLKRARDVNPKIRSQAVVSLFRLQEPTDPEDPVTLTFIDLLAHDSSSDVRRAVLKNIGLSKMSKPLILERITDVKQDIRFLTFQFVQTKLKITHLTIAERMDTLYAGLTDSCPKIQDICEEIAWGWLAAFDNNILQFLSYLDLQNEKYESVMLNLTKKLIKKVSVLPIYSLEADPISIEGLFYLRAYCLLEREEMLFSQLMNYCTKQKNISKELMPEILGMVEILTKATQLKNPNTDEGSPQFLQVKHLFALCHFLDFQDEVGKVKFVAFLENLITQQLQMPDFLIQSALSLLNQISKQKLKQVCSKVYQNLAKTEKTLERRLSVLCGLFHFINDSKSFSKYIDETIKPNFQHKDPKIRLLAHKALGSYLISCECTDDTLLRWIPLLISDIKKATEEQIILSHLHSLFDVTAVFCKNVQKKTSSKFPMAEIVTVLAPFLFNQSHEIQTVCAQGFAKLFLFDPHYCSAYFEDTLIEMMRAFFDPKLATNFSQRQYLTSFFTMYYPENKVICQKAAAKMRKKSDRATQKLLDQWFEANSYKAQQSSPIVTNAKKTLAHNSTSPLSPARKPASVPVQAHTTSSICDETDLSLQQIKKFAIESLTKSIEDCLDSPVKGKVILSPLKKSSSSLRERASSKPKTDSIPKLKDTKILSKPPTRSLPSHSSKNNTSKDITPPKSKKDTSPPKSKSVSGPNHNTSKDITPPKSKKDTSPPKSKSVSGSKNNTSKDITPPKSKSVLGSNHNTSKDITPPKSKSLTGSKNNTSKDTSPPKSKSVSESKNNTSKDITPPKSKISHPQIASLKTRSKPAASPQESKPTKAPVKSLNETRARTSTNSVLKPKDPKQSTTITKPTKATLPKSVSGLAKRSTTSSANKENAKSNLKSQVQTLAQELDDILTDEHPKMRLIKNLESELDDIL